MIQCGPSREQNMRIAHHNEYVVWLKRHRHGSDVIKQAENIINEVNYDKPNISC